MKILFICLLFLLPTTHTMQAQHEVVKIWPELAPGSENKTNEEQWSEGKSVTQVYQPDLTLFLIDKKEKPAPAVVIFPGGGYRQVVMNKEGYKIAEWLNKNGISAFVLKYRLDRDEALDDARRALSMVRSNADKYNIDKAKIGIIGFSAGAHLAGNLVTNHRERTINDKIDEVSPIPDFWIGVYGSYAGITEKTGKVADPQKLPPAFLVHAGNDSKVSVDNSIDLYSALTRMNVPAELHIYEQGEHGFALELDRGPAVTSTVIDWSRRCIEWLKVRGVL